MAIDPKSLEHLEDSLVHDEEEEEKELQPHGVGIYLTPKFLGHSTILAYGAMAFVVLAAGGLYPGERIPVILMPGSLLVALPFAVVGLYLDLTSPPEPVLAKQRTVFGRLATGVIDYVVLQILTAATWVGLALAFKLH